ncbi:MAG: hypothetical protein CMO81_02055 [Waddliaceae bacterium]|nr:hypothetical protein [Waddliaceae bacterium]
MSKIEEKIYSCTCPVLDLRRKPEFSGDLYKQDHLQESQILYGEQVKIIKKSQSWAYIELLQQKKWENDHFVSYRGWALLDYFAPCDLIKEKFVLVKALEIEGNHYSVGCFFDKKQLVGFDSSVFRLFSPLINNDRVCFLQNFLEPFMGTPYHWGGLSSYYAGSRPLTGVDCSGLVHLLYRGMGIEVPRDAHDQYLFCHLIDLKDLAVGDLCFMQPEGKERVDHVMIYLGDGRVMESTMEVNSVRICDLEHRLSVYSGLVFYGRIP